MTEKEKARLGLLYDANYDEELLAERRRCKELCFQFNQLSPLKELEQKEIIGKLFGKTKENFCVTAPFYCDYGYNIEIGENFYSNHNLVILDGAKVEIGDNVFIAPNCCITTAGHPINIDERNRGLEYAYPIKIGNNVWIGAGANILPGVTIGDNVTIGAGSVVNKSIPANSIAVGNPCKVIKTILDKTKGVNSN
ncbi:MULTISPECIES: sugar O-acetyltransferase [Fusobacterium]|jgi:maltose O-acetyltransferase|uniref:Acetyltransferase n=2 Tax=Fusobacterium mortiferum TaxID=850 RepID=A0A414PZ44_FUSMR|nr:MULTISPECIES: sugar O-acetyltransferase [Fusobacterium]AVQ18550.1 sugar O-acetyltransferase [Fusobacterium mortiferum ATCC 9817]EEO34790.1 maltose O-acetyltransferase [Fusobacterium mortiferum ATCC 9817]MCF2627386.1 sugar O-acetyltransferase [Fusobacterium mortiferum]MCF2700385.1 sugar O-acetyltransferase [Fusobacterium mortiferum]MDD7262134.1 sugar O-acetyltransferase [Fusobacterium mortiferum]